MATPKKERGPNVGGAVAPSAYQAFRDLLHELQMAGVTAKTWGEGRVRRKLPQDALLSALLLDFFERYQGPERARAVRALLPRHDAEITGPAADDPKSGTRRGPNPGPPPAGVPGDVAPTRPPARRPRRKRSG